MVYLLFPLDGTESLYFSFSLNFVYQSHSGEGLFIRGAVSDRCFGMAWPCIKCSLLLKLCAYGVLLVLFYGEYPRGWWPVREYLSYIRYCNCGTVHRHVVLDIRSKPTTLTYNQQRTGEVYV